MLELKTARKAVKPAVSALASKVATVTAENKALLQRAIAAEALALITGAEISALKTQPKTKQKARTNAKKAIKEVQTKIATQTRCAREAGLVA